MIKKRGDAAFGIGTLITIIVIIVAAVLILLFSFKGFGFLSDKINLLPGQNLQALSESCSISGAANLKIDYCGFKEIKVDGQDQYINCDHSQIQDDLKQKPDLDMAGFPDCTGISEEKEFCIQLRDKADPEYTGEEIVNGRVCGGEEANAKAWGVTAESESSLVPGTTCLSLGGEYKSLNPRESCPGNRAELTKDVTDFTGRLEVPNGLGEEWRCCTKP